MNLLNYLKSKYRKFLSTGLDNENKNQNLNLEQSNKIANSITLSILGFYDMYMNVHKSFI